MTIRLLGRGFRTHTSRYQKDNEDAEHTSGYTSSIHMETIAYNGSSISCAVEYLAGIAYDPTVLQPALQGARYDGYRWIISVVGVCWMYVRRSRRGSRRLWSPYAERSVGSADVGCV